MGNSQRTGLFSHKRDFIRGLRTQAMIDGQKKVFVGPVRDQGGKLRIADGVMAGMYNPGAHSSVFSANATAGSSLIRDLAKC